MYHVIHQISYIILIHFLFNQSYLHYYYCYIFYFNSIGHLNSNFWLPFILILDIYDQNYNIIYEIQIIIINFS